MSKRKHEEEPAQDNQTTDNSASRYAVERPGVHLGNRFTFTGLLKRFRESEVFGMGEVVFAAQPGVNPDGLLRYEGGVDDNGLMHGCGVLEYCCGDVRAGEFARGLPVSWSVVTVLCTTDPATHVGWLGTSQFLLDASKAPHAHSRSRPDPSVVDFEHAFEQAKLERVLTERAYERKGIANLAKQHAEQARDQALTRAALVGWQRDNVGSDPNPFLFSVSSMLACHCSIGVTTAPCLLIHRTNWGGSDGSDSSSDKHY